MTIINMAKKLPFAMRACASYFYCGVLYSDMLLSIIDKKTHSILDVGCGRGSSAAGIRKDLNLLIVGADIFVPYIRILQEAEVYNDLVVCDCRNLPIKTKTFDTVLFVNVLEHLTKSEGKDVIRKLEEIAVRQVIIYTQVGFLRQDAVLEGNIYSIHKSGWLPNELRNIGYSVKGTCEIPFSRFLFLPLLIEPFIYFKPEVGLKLSRMLNRGINSNFKTARFGMLCIKKLLKREAIDRR